MDERTKEFLKELKVLMEKYDTTFWITGSCVINKVKINLDNEKQLTPEILGEILK